MVDRRNDILERLEAVLTAVAADYSPTMHFHRNRGELPDDLRPSISMFDAHEVADQRAFERGRPGASPNMVRITAEIYITLQSRKPKNEKVGEDLNAARVQILKAVLTDQQLQRLCGSNGEMRYDGCVTDLARGQAMDGEMGITISFAYPFKPLEL